MSKASVNPWFVRQPARPECRVRLFCFPHAGGNAWVFRQWSKWLPASVEVCSIQLPGRANRIREPAIADLAAVLDWLTLAITPELDRPWAMFGHSLGSLIAFELARRFRKQLKAEPVHLFVSGHNAPHLANRPEVVSGQDDSQFTETLRRLKYTPEPLLRDPAWRGLMIPTLRADFSLYEQYVYRDEPPLGCPITVLAGKDDSFTNHEGAQAWGRQTCGPLDVTWYPGDHFFVMTHEQAVAAKVGERLERAG
jgi:medium-chain acyl-[acyl-carrier-protein] hydrolase